MSNKTKLKLILPIGYLGIVLIYFWQTFLVGPVQFHQIVGALITVVAFGFWIVARVQLGDAFSLIPKAQYLMDKGLYSKIRHPVYYFSILALFGLALFSQQPYVWAGLVTLVGLEAIRIRREDTVLRRKFGSKYEDYKKKTWF